MINIAPERKVYNRSRETLFQVLSVIGGLFGYSSILVFVFGYCYSNDFESLLKRKITRRPPIQHPFLEGINIRQVDHK